MLNTNTCTFYFLHVELCVCVCVCVCVCMCVCVCHSEDLGEYMESKGASSPGILTLTTNLSKPFTRLERYPTLLKELDRHMEVSDKPLMCLSFLNRFILNNKQCFFVSSTRTCLHCMSMLDLVNSLFIVFLCFAPLC